MLTQEPEREGRLVGVLLGRRQEVEPGREVTVQIALADIARRIPPQVVQVAHVADHDYPARSVAPGGSPGSGPTAMGMPARVQSLYEPG